LQIGSEKGSSLLDFMESRCLTVPVIFYTTFMDVDVILDVMERGAVTVLNKALDSTKLLDYVSSAIETDRRQSELSEIYCNVRGILDRLTVRQRDILGFIVQGISTKMIADRFHVSQRLIEKERSEILRQFRVSATPDVTLMMGEYRAINDLWSHPRWRVTTHGWPVASRN
jgi:FixJ family two-component response regulator